MVNFYPRSRSRSPLGLFLFVLSWAVGFDFFFGVSVLDCEASVEKTSPFVLGEEASFLNGLAKLIRPTKKNHLLKPDVKEQPFLS